MNDVGGVEQPKRWVAIFYVAAAVVLGIFLEKIIQLVFAYARINDYTVVGDYTVSTLIGFAIAVATAIALWRLPKTRQVSLEVALELRRVTWPTARETRAATVAVIVASFVAAIILGVFDVFWAWLSAQFYGT